MQVDLSGTSALVTGATRGIGLAVARLLAGNGARVVVSGKSVDSVEQALLELRGQLPDALFSGAPGDLTTPEGCSAVAGAAGDVDILVSNAAFYQWKPFFELSDEDWQNLISINLMAGVRLTRRLLPSMLKRNWGRVVFVASEAGFNIPTDMIHYGVSKAAEIAAARGLAELTRGTGVTVNSVLPGPTASSEVDSFLTEHAKTHGIPPLEAESHLMNLIRPTSLLQRLAHVDEVAHMILYACSREASATNGAALRVEGGVLRHPG